jgi:hypothetical protein
MRETRVTDMFLFTKISNWQATWVFRADRLQNADERNRSNFKFLPS